MATFFFEVTYKRHKNIQSKLKIKAKNTANDSKNGLILGNLLDQGFWTPLGTKLLTIIGSRYCITMHPPPKSKSEIAKNP